MAKKTIFTILILLGVISIVGIGVYYFISLGNIGNIEQTEATSDDGSASMSATFWDIPNGEVVPIGGGTLQALIGGTNRRTHVSFSLKGTNTGDISLSNIQPVTPNANMNGAFNGVTPLATLNIGASNVLVATTNETCVTSANCDTNEQCCNQTSCNNPSGGNRQCLIWLDQYASQNASASNPVSFTVSLGANFTNAQGGIGTLSSSAVTLTFDIRGEKCSDGTSIFTCATTKPNYCKFIEGSMPTIINNATFCGCPAGYHQDVGTENCVPDACPDGTIAGSFSTATGLYTITTPSGSGSYPLLAGFVTSLNNTRVFCRPNLVLQTECNNARITLGGGVLTNEYACKKDALDRYASACSPSGTVNLSTCVYAPINPSLTGTITE